MNADSHESSSSFIFNQNNVTPELIYQDTSVIIKSATNDDPLTSSNNKQSLFKGSYLEEKSANHYLWSKMSITQLPLQQMMLSDKKKGERVDISMKSLPNLNAELKKV